MSVQPASFAARVLRWQREHGRHHLPWQGQRDPYRVWLSEIMLQQTQVATVLDYYPKFLLRFPTVTELALASQDDVLAMWSGLGYYSRARNLHRCAQVVLQDYGGEFPKQAQGLEKLPGIGRSTAAAIAAFCFGETVAILDGNVKRVIARHAGFDADLAVAKNVDRLWDIATERLPNQNPVESMPRYTQGLMDIGATLCTARAPQCSRCPVKSDCQAHLQGRPQDLPVKTKKLKRSSQSLWLLLAQNLKGQVWLDRRPSNGVWGGLYTPPLFNDLLSLQASIAPREALEDWPVIKHVLTHKDLFLHPVHVRGDLTPQADGDWYHLAQALKLGLPTPIRSLLSALGSS